jgi:catechol 2,3-dioxygenase-like lactoylglutathione lyase family enzyme
MEPSRAVPVLTVPDLAAAVATYRDVLGLDVLMDLGWVVTLGRGAAAQVTLLTSDRTAPVNPVATLDLGDVSAVDRAHDEAVRRGLEVVHPLTDEAWGVRRFFVRDPGGNVINVLAHRDPAAWQNRRREGVG